MVGFSINEEGLYFRSSNACAWEGLPGSGYSEPSVKKRAYTFWTLVKVKNGLLDSRKSEPSNCNWSSHCLLAKWVWKVSVLLVFGLWSFILLVFSVWLFCSILLFGVAFYLLLTYSGKRCDVVSLHCCDVSTLKYSSSTDVEVEKGPI